MRSALFLFLTLTGVAGAARPEPRCAVSVQPAPALSYVALSAQPEERRLDVQVVCDTRQNEFRLSLLGAQGGRVRMRSAQTGDVLLARLSGTEPFDGLTWHGDTQVSSQGLNNAQGARTYRFTLTVRPDPAQWGGRAGSYDSDLGVVLEYR